MNIRELSYTASGAVDCEIEHPVYGWIPFTASHDDPEEFGRTLHAEIIADQHGAIAPYVEPEPAPPAVPQSITMRKARLCLHKHGMLAGVQPAIDSLEEPDRTAAQIEWDYSSVVERDRGFVLTIAKALEISDEQLDALFIEAATL